MVMKKQKKSNSGLRQAALEYHQRSPKGKIEVVATKPCFTQHDLSLAYTPGVAEPCLEIKKNAEKALEYTAKGNLVAVISNGTAVLGLGNIGALAGKPVMEGKGVLFKRFANIDVFDIELDTENADEIIKTVKYISPTFGGINLEDIKAPDCFYIEETLKKELNIPVFHDDQHGTAIISGAALINALELVNKKIDEVKVVYSGAGAAGIACANFYISLGVRPENMLMTDSKGVLWSGRGDEDKNQYKNKFFRDTDARTLADAINGADVFCGVSIKGVLTKEMVRTMAGQPIIFAMANPDPEITYEDAKKARPDAIVATGRSDFPNQVNNVLGFPFIFRGTLDVQAKSINEEMKRAAAYALANLAKEEVPDSVKRAYDIPDISFGPDYIIPKPFDPRVLVWESVAVAKAAIESGVAQKEIDLDEYKEQLMEQLDWSREIMRKVHVIAKKDPKRIVFPEGEHPKIIWAASEIVREGIAKPILLAKSKKGLLKKFKTLHHSAKGIEIIEPKRWPYRNQYLNAYYELRQRKGITWTKAAQDLRNYIPFAAMMVQEGHADAMIAGVDTNYPEVLRPALQIIGTHSNLAAGLYMVIHEHKLYSFADCSVNINPDAEQLAKISIMAAEEMEKLHIQPVIAMLSFSNFGSVRKTETNKVEKAVRLVREQRPDLIVDGPIQADTALNTSFIKEHFTFSPLRKRPNVLIFPTLDAGNISLKLISKFGNVNTIGPIMMGMRKPIHLLIRGTEVNSILNIVALATIDAQKRMEFQKKGKSEKVKLTDETVIVE
jgi:malate dehydrogenase (oxaloacetate-decarboxylating)(NADP+)